MLSPEVSDLIVRKATGRLSRIGWVAALPPLEKPSLDKGLSLWSSVPVYGSKLN